MWQCVDLSPDLGSILTVVRLWDSAEPWSSQRRVN